MNRLRGRDPRRLLIKEVWPDKLLYGAIMLTVSAGLGFLNGAVAMLTDISFGTNLGPWLAWHPTWLTVVLSAGALVLGLASWRRFSVGLGVLGAILGIASVSLAGIGSLHAVVALGFLLLAKLEREDKVPKRDRVDRWDWPDKALAASLLLVLAGVYAVAWGLLVVFDQTGFGGDDHLYWGSAQIVAAALALVASQYLYYQRAPVFSAIACILIIVTAAGYLIAPGLAAAALVAVWLAWREGEFRPVTVQEETAPALSPAAKEPE